MEALPDLHDHIRDRPDHHAGWAAQGCGSTASTTASARRWPAWKASWLSGRCCAASPSSAAPSPRRAALGPRRRPRAARPVRAVSHSGTGRAQPASMIHSAAPRGRPARFADHLPPDSVRSGAAARHPAGPGHQPHHPEHPDLNRPRHRSAVCQMRPDDPAHDQADAPSSCMTEGR